MGRARITDFGLAVAVAMATVWAGGRLALGRRSFLSLDRLEG